MIDTFFLIEAEIARLKQWEEELRRREDSIRQSVESLQTTKEQTPTKSTLSENTSKETTQLIDNKTFHNNTTPTPIQTEKLPEESPNQKELHGTFNREEFE